MNYNNQTRERGRIHTHTHTHALVLVTGCFKRNKCGPFDFRATNSRPINRQDERIEISTSMALVLVEFGAENN